MAAGSAYGELLATFSLEELQEESWEVKLASATATTIGASIGGARTREASESETRTYGSPCPAW